MAINPLVVRLAPLLSGVLMALAFPNVGWGWLGWLALVPLFSVVQHRPWRSGFSAGVVFFAIVLYWLNIVMTTYGHLPWWLALIAYSLLVIYLASFWGAICWCSCRIERRLRLPRSVLLPVIWVAAEFVRNSLLTGFPWANIAYSQADYALMIQGADLGGVYLLVLLLVAVNSSLANLWLRLRQRRPVPLCELLVVLLVWSGHCGYGWWRLHTTNNQHGHPLRIALIQGNIEQSLKWDARHLQATLDVYQQLSAQVDAAQMIVWPESATPFFYQDGGSQAKRVRDVARDSAALLLFGSPAYVQRDNDYRYLNSAYLLSAQGQPLGRSDKVHLVPFGEYVPLSTVLRFVDKLAAGIGDFVPGQLQLLGFDDHKIGVLVCYEAIFPELARRQVRMGAQLLVNLTNDAWFGESSAPWQHLAMARFRAVENRIWLARCANTGVSALIDPSGQIVAQSPLFTATRVEGVVYLRDATSLYTRSGDSVPLLFCVVVMVWLWQSRKKPVH